jgi:hypothetical protein
LSTTYKILSNVLLSRVNPYVDEIVLGVISVHFNLSYQLLIAYSAFISCWIKKNRIQLGFKKVCVLFKKEVLYNILTECGILVNIVWLIKVCVENAIWKSGEASVLSHTFPTQKVLQ